jgi:hypothetical protein
MDIEEDGGATPIERIDAVLATQGYEWDEAAEEWRRADGTTIPLEDAVGPHHDCDPDRRRPDAPSDPASEP